MASSSFLSSPASTAILLFLYISLLLPTSISPYNNPHPKSRRILLSLNNEEDPKPKSPPQKKPVSQSLTPINKTKSLKSKKSNSTISSSSPKLNKTISSTNKTLTPIPIPLTPNLNKTTKSNITKPLKSPNPPPKAPKNPNPAPKSSKPKPSLENWLNEDDDIIAEFRDLPSRLQSAIVPDLHKLSATSKLYFSKTHREIAAGVKPFVGKRYAPSIASAASAALLLLPLLLVSALFRLILRTGSTASLYRAILFVQAYLAIYFATLSLTALVTGLEPLRFFYATSPGAYAWTQAVQTFGYVVYLIVQLIVLVIAFSAGDGELAAGKAVSLAQMLLGLAVGMHYYITVFHRAVTGEVPRANWKVHGIYAACFLVICGLGRADRRKKSYIQEDGGDDGKKS